MALRLYNTMGRKMEDFVPLQAGKAGFYGCGPTVYLGVTKNVEIYVRKVAPLGDPIEVTVRNYELSIRKADAEMIEIKEDEEN